MINFPDFTLPPINLYVMARLEHTGQLKRTLNGTRKEREDAERINRLLQMRNRG